MVHPCGPPSSEERSRSLTASSSLVLPWTPSPYQLDLAAVKTPSCSWHQTEPTPTRNASAEKLSDPHSSKTHRPGRRTEIHSSLICHSFKCVHSFNAPWLKMQGLIIEEGYLESQVSCVSKRNMDVRLVGFLCAFFWQKGQSKSHGC